MAGKNNETSAAQPKIWVLYARFGEGHLQAAQALKSGFERAGVDNVKLVDLLAEAHPRLNGLSRFVYKKSYTLWPKAYGFVYNATKDMSPHSAFAYLLHSFGVPKLRKMLEAELPDAVIHTFPNLALPFADKRNRLNIPMFNVITDFDLHMRWVHPRIRKYYIATEELGHQLASIGIPRSRIAVTGIPLRRPFGPAGDLRADVLRYGLDPARRVVLYMAGADAGRTDVSRRCRRLAAETGAQIALVCGRDSALETAMRRSFASGRDNVFVFGYVERMDELMGLSDCIVTKPGGLTLSEAIEAGLPMFLLRPMPGQEWSNAQYLQAKGAAVVCGSSDELARSVSVFLKDGKRREEMKAAVASLRKRNAADRIALDILANLPIIKSNGNRFAANRKPSYRRIGEGWPARSQTAAAAAAATPGSAGGEAANRAALREAEPQLALSGAANSAERGE